MKKITTLTALFLLLSFGVGLIGPGLSVSAKDTDLSSPGITPDSFFYFLDILWEKINLTFTFSAEKKVKKALEYADEKLAETKVMAKENNLKALEKSNKKYKEYLSLANEKVQKIKKQGKDVEELVALITEKTLKHQEVLSEVLEKVPEQARKGIKNAIEMSQKGYENAIEAVSGEKKQELEQKAEEMREKVQAKIRAVEKKGEPGEEEEEEEEENGKPPIGGNFFSPEVAFNTFLTAIENRDAVLFLGCMSERSLKVIEEDPNMSMNIEDPETMFGEESDVSIYREASYQVTEKTSKYAIMAPQTRTVVVEGVTGTLPNFYFEKEKELWKIDMIALITDATLRLFPGAEQEIQAFIDVWKESMKQPSGYIEME